MEATWHCLSVNRTSADPGNGHWPWAQCFPISSPSSTSTCPQGRVTQTLHPSINAAFWVLSSVQSLSHVRLFATPWTAARQASLSITSSQSLLRLMSIESVMPSNHLILCRPLLLPPSVFPSIRGFSSESSLRMRGPKYWSFSFSIGPSNEHPGLISFRMDWLDLLAVQGTLKSLLQHIVQTGAQDPAVPSPSDPNPLPSSV